MSLMQPFLKKEVVFLQSNRDKWNLIIFMMVFVPLFLLFFQPFGVNNFNQQHSISTVFLISMLGFGLVQGVVLGIYEFIIVPFLFKEKTWATFIIRMLTEFLAIAFFTFLYYNILGDFHDWYFGSFMSFVFNISLMSIIPFALIFLYSNYKHSENAYNLLELQPKLELSKKYIHLQSYNKKEQLAITLNDLLFIEAQDNYVLVYYLERGNVKKQLLRATMKDVETNLKEDFVMRCHRSFIVNINKVEKVSKEGHYMKLFLPHIEDAIPVSRSYFKGLEAVLYVHHK